MVAESFGKINLDVKTKDKVPLVGIDDDIAMRIILPTLLGQESIMMML